MQRLELAKIRVCFVYSLINTWILGWNKTPSTLVITQQDRQTLLVLGSRSPIQLALWHPVFLSMEILYSIHLFHGVNAFDKPLNREYQHTLKISDLMGIAYRCGLVDFLRQSLNWEVNSNSISVQRRIRNKFNLVESIVQGTRRRTISTDERNDTYGWWNGV